MTDDILDKIFKSAVSNSPIFRDKRVLYHDYIPDKLPFRDHEIARLGRLISPIIRREKSSNVFIYGKPGTGKTAVTKYVLKRLSDFLVSNNVEAYVTYVNCRLAGTEYRVILKIGSDIGISLPFTGLSVEEALSRIQTRIFENPRPLIIVLDEIDVLVTRYGDQLLYFLTRSDYNDRYVPYMIIGISNDLRFKENLDPRVLSSLSEEELVFKPYTASELEVILRDRVRVGFQEKVVDDASIRLAAAFSASEHGDARKALDIIRVAGEIAEEKGDNRVTEDHVREAYKRIDIEKTHEVVRTLPLHSKLILISLVRQGDGNIQSSKLYSYYSQMCKMIGEEPLSYRRFYSLISELSIMGLVTRRIYNFGRKGGRTSSVRLNIDYKDIIDTLKDDPLLEGLL